MDTESGLVFVVSGDLWGGAESMAVNLLGALRGGGVAARAITFNEGLTAERLRLAGVETRVVDERWPFPVMVVQACRLLRRRPVHLIHSHGYKENILAAALAPLLGRPRLVSTMHGLPEPGDGQRGALKRQIVGRLNLALLARRFSVTVAVSEAVRRELVERFGLPAGRVAMISNGIPVPPNLNGQPDRQRLTIGSAGRLCAVKNFPLLIEVAALVCQHRPEVRFKILGDGPDRPALEEMVRDRRLEGTVEFLGFRPDPSPVYESFDIYLNTSRHEGMPLAVLEAMGRAVPVVAPRVGGFPEIITEGGEGFLASAPNAEELAERCIRLIDDDSLRRRMGEAARRRVAQHFSLEAMERSYRQLYDDLTRGRQDLG